LKRAYGNKISALARNRINHINKQTFLLAFKVAFKKVFTRENACAGFRGARLSPHNPQAVLSKLDVQLRIQTPPQQVNTAWEAKTPRNAKEMEAQSTLVQNRVQIHQGSPASSLDEQVQQLTKGAQQMAYKIVFMRAEIVRLEAATEATKKRKSRKRRYIQAEEILTVGEVLDLIAIREGGRREEGEEPAKRVRLGRRCGCCGEIGHNSRTCKVEIEDVNNSDASE
jgi:hypothetical protein